MTTIDPLHVVELELPHPLAMSNESKVATIDLPSGDHSGKIGLFMPDPKSGSPMFHLPRVIPVLVSRISKLSGQPLVVGGSAIPLIAARLPSGESATL